MTTRREFMIQTGTLAAGTLVFQSCSPSRKEENMGLQLYTFRKEMALDPNGHAEEDSGNRN